VGKARINKIAGTRRGIQQPAPNSFSRLAKIVAETKRPINIPFSLQLRAGPDPLFSPSFIASSNII